MGSPWPAISQADDRPVREIRPSSDRKAEVPLRGQSKAIHKHRTHPWRRMQRDHLPEDAHLPNAATGKLRKKLDPLVTVLGHCVEIYPTLTSDRCPSGADLYRPFKT